MNNNYKGVFADFIEFIANPVNACFGSLGAPYQVYTQVVKPTGAHQAYWSTFMPLSDGRTPGQICIDKTNDLA